MKIINNKNRGFTMIELIIVISILGVLAAFALPRFGNFSSNAKEVTKEGIKASLNSAIGIAHAQWIANGATASVTLDAAPTSITMNSSGYPDVGVTYNNIANCQSLVSALLSNSSGLIVGYSSGSSVCTVTNTNWSDNILLSSTSAN